MRVARDSFAAGRNTSSSVGTDANISDCYGLLECCLVMNFTVGYLACRLDLVDSGGRHSV